MHHLLQQVPYTEVPQQTVGLPERVFNPEYERSALPGRAVRPGSLLTRFTDTIYRPAS
jgi:hypothetical protein